MGEVVGAVERVDDPEVLGIGVSRVCLLGQDLVRRVVSLDNLDDGLFGFEVGVGNEVGDVLVSHRDPITKVTGDDGASHAGSLLGDVQFRQAHSGLPSRKVWGQKTLH